MSTKHDNGGAHDVRPFWQLGLRAAIKKHGQLTAIATRAEMAPQALLRIANGRVANPGICTMAKIANALGLSLSEFLHEGPRPKKAGTALHVVAERGRVEAHLGVLFSHLTRLGPSDRAKFIRALISLLEAVNHDDRTRRSVTNLPSVRRRVAARR